MLEEIHPCCPLHVIYERNSLGTMLQFHKQMAEILNKHNFWFSSFDILFIRASKCIPIGPPIPSSVSGELIGDLIELRS